jgi:hypothetical protein
VRIGVERAQSDRLLEMWPGFVEPALPRQHDAQIVMYFGHVGPNRQNLAASHDRVGQPARAMFAPCQVKEGIQLGSLSGRLAGRRHQVWFAPAAGNSGQDLQIVD